jgi:hypothetical protein
MNDQFIRGACRKGRFVLKFESSAFCLFGFLVAIALQLEDYQHDIPLNSDVEVWLRCLLVLDVLLETDFFKSKLVKSVLPSLDTFASSVPDSLPL